ncbi:MAG: diguanylate cyclase [Acidobacteria bacterium]|uniref:diguanylate cyclase n=1 Tax=Candidatus Polarisedimenticola svalbardensis TaxID=2886004 RepID=A0A8J6XUV9_9BACT|nr:diguanylate cyclase [Candidatus Polarisedimenticola svalbardensis]
MGAIHRNDGNHPRRSTGGRWSRNGSFIIDGKGMVLGFDEGMEALTGWNAASVVGHGHRSRAAGRIKENRRAEARPQLFAGTVEIPEDHAATLMRIHCRDGSSLDVEANVRRLAGQGLRAQITVQRVVARSGPNEGEMPVGEIDPLTGLLHADAFSVLLEKEVEHAGITANPVALILADIDHLRNINDKLGYEEGNTVLRKVAEILRAAAGDAGIPGRLENDDFAILLPGSGRGDSRQMAAAVRSTVERYRFFPRNLWPGKITLSLGSASFPADALNPQALLGRAREALDEARALGRNRVWCYLRRPRVPVQVPVYFEGTESLLVGYTRDLSPSGVFVQTSAPIDIGMRCALNFPLPGHQGNVHVIGKVVRAVPPELSPEYTAMIPIPGMGLEFEQFGGPEDQLAIDTFLHEWEATTQRPESGPLSF